MIVIIIINRYNIQKITNPGVIKEAQVVVKVESETTEVAPCQFPHLVAQHCIAYTYGIR